MTHRLAKEHAAPFPNSATPFAGDQAAAVAITGPFEAGRTLAQMLRTRWAAMRRSMEPDTLCYTYPALEWQDDPALPEMAGKIAGWNAYSDDILNELAPVTCERFAG